MNKKVNRLFLVNVVLVVLAIAFADRLFPAGVVRAQTTQTLTLISGDGPTGSRDTANQFTVDGGATWQDAYIVTPIPGYDVIPGTQYISLSPNLSGPLHATTRYRTTFELPAGFSDPALTVEVHADNVATLFLNGVQIGQQPFAEIFANFQNPTESFTSADPSLFVPGTNILEFDIHNFTGPTAFDYQATVSFDPVLEVALDIKPDDPVNNINPRSKGRIPVAVLTTGSFDAASLDTETLRFGKTWIEAVPAHFALEDVDGDGDIDLMLHFKTQETGVSCGDTAAILTGATVTVEAVTGSDVINTVGCA